MKRPLANQKKQLLIILSLILVVGFLMTSLASYFVSRASLRDQIASTTLPLTSDTIYSEIQRDLLRPIFVSSLMANDTFLRDWILDGEKDDKQLSRYLKEIMSKHEIFASFLVSEATRIYYHADGILKKVNPEEERDRWYFRVREMEPAYEINVDPDFANEDALTIFVNQKVFDYKGEYIGATGIGLTLDSVIALMKDYGRKYGRNIYFVDKGGSIVLHNVSFLKKGDNIHNIEGLSLVASDVLSTDENVQEYSRQGEVIHLSSRHVPELNWHLLVEQTEEQTIENVHSALVINLIVCALITAIVILLTTFTITAYQKTNQAQQEKIVGQHQELLKKNSELEDALSEVKKLSGLLPICASCKKVRDDNGYWRQIESYIRDHSEAEFSHGICPNCAQELYPEFHNGNSGKNAVSC